MPTPRIIMIGPNICGKGGISSVLQAYKEFGLFSRLNIDYYYVNHKNLGILRLPFFIYKLLYFIFFINRYDIVHIHSASRWSFRRKSCFIILGKLFRRKIILHIHGGKFNLFYNRASFFEKVLIKRCFALSDSIILLSTRWKQKLAHLCDERKILVIPNCIDNEKTINIDDKLRLPKLLLFLGELRRRKGVYDLLEAIKISNLKKDEIRVFLCGNGEIEKVKELVVANKLDRTVKIPGWVGQKEKDLLLKKAYMLILPSYHEGLPMSILEALAYGTPVISTNVGGIPDAVQDGVNGFLVPPGSPKLLSARISELLSAENLWKDFSRNAQEIVRKKFSMEYLEKSLLKIYSLTL